MNSIEVVLIYDQYCFEYPGSEQEIELVRGKCDLWESPRDFIHGASDYVWGELKLVTSNVDELSEFKKDISISLNRTKDIAIPDGIKDVFLVCNDWNMKAMLWKHKKYFYLLCWSTTA